MNSHELHLLDQDIETFLRDHNDESKLVAVHAKQLQLLIRNVRRRVEIRENLPA